MQERLIGIPEVAKILGVSTFTVRRLMDAKALRFVRVSRRVLIPQSEIDRVCREGCSSHRRAVPCESWANQQS
jgi:excisionase family DNA binding protein